jgi:hypothetical protein
MGMCGPVALRPSITFLGGLLFVVVRPALLGAALRFLLELPPLAAAFIARVEVLKFSRLRRHLLFGELPNAGRGNMVGHSDEANIVPPVVRV